MQKYNQVNSEVQKFADTLNYDKIQDQLKEDMAFTSTWTKKQWEDISKEAKECQARFEGSLNKEQIAMYEECKAYQTLLTLAMNDMKKR